MALQITSMLNAVPPMSNVMKNVSFKEKF